MASQVLSGSSNPSYTNNTGQNVRVVINFMRNVTSISHPPKTPRDLRLSVPASRGPRRGWLWPAPALR